MLLKEGTSATSLKRMKTSYDLKILLRPYDKGVVVYILDTATIKGKSKKLLSPWKGPVIIIDKLSPYLYSMPKEGNRCGQP